MSIGGLGLGMSNRKLRKQKNIVLPVPGNGRWGVHSTKQEKGIYLQVILSLVAPLIIKKTSWIFTADTTRNGYAGDKETN